MAGRTLKKKVRESIIAVLAGTMPSGSTSSYAREKRKTRVIDLVRFARPKSLIQIVQIEDEIKKSIHMNVDLVTEKAVSPYLANTIHRDEVVIFG